MSNKYNNYQLPKLTPEEILADTKKSNERFRTELSHQPDNPMEDTEYVIKHPYTDEVK